MQGITKFGNTGELLMKKDKSVSAKKMLRGKSTNIMYGF